jgi:hypothetical protein
MPKIGKRLLLVWFLGLVLAIAGGAKWLTGQDSFKHGSKTFDNSSVLFTQQDVLPSFGDQAGVRLGTAKGIISGTITTNFFFTVPPPQQPPGGPFVADDWALLIDTEGNQILFEVHSEGTVTFDTLSPDPTNFLKGIVPFRAPFVSTYEAVAATGRLSKYQGLTFPARGTGVISTQVFFGLSRGLPVGTVYVEVGRTPISK